MVLRRSAEQLPKDSTLPEELRAHLQVIEQKLDSLTLKVDKRWQDGDLQLDTSSEPPDFIQMTVQSPQPAQGVTTPPGAQDLAASHLWTSPLPAEPTNSYAMEPQERRPTKQRKTPPAPSAVVTPEPLLPGCPKEELDQMPSMVHEASHVSRKASGEGSRRVTSFRRRTEGGGERDERRSSLVSVLSENVAVGRLRSFFQLPSISSEGLGISWSKFGFKSATQMLTQEDIEKQWLWQVVHSERFQYLCSAVILLNVVAIGIHADDDLRARLNKEQISVVHEHVDILFGAYFAFELLLRLLAESRFFFVGSEWKWNLFDSVLVVLSLVDTALHAIYGLGSMANVTTGRILRFVRFLRVIRIARALRAFHSLRIVVFAIFESMLALAWCLIVVFLIIYMFAILFLYGITEHLSDIDKVPKEEVTSIEKLYGSVLRAMVTLFMTITGGIDWQNAVGPLVQVTWMYEPIFNFYIFFMAIGVMNVVVGAFVAATAEISARDRDFLIKNEMSQLQAYARKVQTFFREADKDRSGCLTWAEFKEYLKTPKVSAYFRALELDVSQAHVVFKLLDWDDSDEVSLEEFLQGCMRLKGPAKSLDVNMLLYENKRMYDKFSNFVSEVMLKLEQKLEQQNQELTPLDSPLGTSRPSNEDDASEGKVPRKWRFERSWPGGTLL